MIIERRYNGPPGSGNGGWSAGTVAAHLDSPAGIMVTLRIPPPLDTPLSVEYVDSGVAVYTPRGIRVADAAPSVVPPDPIEPVPYQQAVEVSAGYPGFTAHPFPTCFVCGPQREPGDGLRLFRDGWPMAVPRHRGPSRMTCRRPWCGPAWTAQVAGRSASRRGHTCWVASARGWTRYPDRASSAW